MRLSKTQAEKKLNEAFPEYNLEHLDVKQYNPTEVRLRVVVCDKPKNKNGNRKTKETG